MALIHISNTLQYIAAQLLTVTNIQRMIELLLNHLNLTRIFKYFNFSITNHSHRVSSCTFDLSMNIRCTIRHCLAQIIYMIRVAIDY